MRDVHIDKVVVHMGVGESGEKLVKAENIMKTITKQTPIRSVAKYDATGVLHQERRPDRVQGYAPGKTGTGLYQDCLAIVNKTVFESQFDKSGNFSFGIEEHTDFPGMSYDPQIGIFGMDVNVVLERNGIRITRRRMQQKKLPEKQRVKKEDAIAFLKKEYSVEVR